MGAAPFQQRCVKCGKAFPHAATFFCDACDGFLDVDYDLSRVRLRHSDNPLERYFDLLPVRDAANQLWLGCGNTPCLHARELGRKLGLERLYLKDETANPTWTTKDRMASVVLSFFRDVGVREFVSSSTGNSSTALAVGAQKHPEFTVHLFVAEDFLDRVNIADSPNVRVYVLEGGTFVEAFQTAAEFAKQRGLLAERGFFNVSRREGLKLAFLEALDQLPAAPDWYFQAVSSAMGVYGAYKGALQYRGLGRLAHLPRFCCVQQETCCPMVKAWNDGSPVIQPQHLVPHPTGIAKAILRGDPRRSYPAIYPIVKATGGQFVSVNEEEILAAQELVQSLEGIRACATSSCTVAAVQKLRERGMIAADELVVLNITGRERTTPEFPARPSEYHRVSRDSALVSPASPT